MCKVSAVKGTKTLNTEKMFVVVLQRVCIIHKVLTHINDISRFMIVDEGYEFTEALRGRN